MFIYVVISAVGRDEGRFAGTIVVRLAHLRAPGQTRLPSIRPPPHIRTFTHSPFTHSYRYNYTYL